MPDEFMFLILGVFALLLVGILVSARGERPRTRLLDLSRPSEPGQRRERWSGG